MLKKRSTLFFRKKSMARNKQAAVTRPTIHPQMEWERARQAANRMEEMLADEISYLTHGGKLKNVYSPVAWIRLCRTIRTLTSGMVVMRLTFEDKSNDEICQITGLTGQTVAAYKAWNTMYARDIQKMLAVRGKTEVQRKRDLEFLTSIGVSL